MAVVLRSSAAARRLTPRPSSAHGSHRTPRSDTRLLARARAALERTTADVGFGLEGGAILDGDRAWLTAHVVAVTRDGRIGEAAWGRMLLPRVAAERLRAGEELGDVIDDLFNARESKRQTGAIGLLTEGAVSRTDAFADLVAMACAPFLRPDLYNR